MACGPLDQGTALAHQRGSFERAGNLTVDTPAGGFDHSADVANLRVGAGDSAYDQVNDRTPLVLRSQDLLNRLPHVLLER